jgi:hypothetical protein
MRSRWLFTLLMNLILFAVHRSTGWSLSKDKFLNLKQEVGFVGTIRKEKEIRLTALPVDGKNLRIGTKCKQGD